MERRTGMKTISKVIEDVSIVLGVSLGIAQIETILGIVLLVFQIGLIIYKLIRSIIDKIKKKDYDGIENDIKNATDEIEKLTPKDKDGK